MKFIKSLVKQEDPVEAERIIRKMLFNDDELFDLILEWEEVWVHLLALLCLVEQTPEESVAREKIHKQISEVEEMALSLPYAGPIPEFPKGYWLQWGIEP